MMGRREGGQSQFFYSFDLDKVVPPDHLIRQIEAVLDLNWVHKELAPYYSHTGRPSIDPVLMIKMLIVGYVFAIRSERRLCSEIQVKAYRWFCQLGIEDSIPDHSVFCRARHERFRESDALRHVFEGVVAKCITAGLVGLADKGLVGKNKSGKNMAKIGGARPGAGRPKGVKNKRTREIAENLLKFSGITPLDVMMEAMRTYHAKGFLEKAAAIAKDAAPYMHPRLTSVDVGGKQGQPIEAKDVTNEELSRRIAFILGQAAREKAGA